MMTARLQRWRSFSKLSAGLACALFILATLLLLGSQLSPARGNSDGDAKPLAASGPAGTKAHDRRENGTSRSETNKADAIALADVDADGFPDAAEVASFRDRENFRRWFTAIAETQFYELSDEWSDEQRDCAGLVRFSLREALRAHDRAWFQKMGAGYEAIAPDVAAYKLGAAPLGEKIFRTRPGVFHPTDLADASFSEFADARTLKDFNCVFVGRDQTHGALPGDLIFFHQPLTREFPYHVMIFIGEAHRGDRAETGGDWVVYHTGATAKDAGLVKKVRLSVLERHPDKRWRPVAVNPNFLGFYRLKILD